MNDTDNEMDPAERIRQKQRYMHLLAEIVENLRGYFDELANRRFGQPVRFVVLTNIESVHKVGRRGLQLVRAIFHTELGNINLSIAIKDFDSQEEALVNKELTRIVFERLEKDIGRKDIPVQTPKVIFHYDKTLIYEGIDGGTFLETGIDNEVKLRLAGSALARFQGDTIKSADPKRYLFLLRSVLEKLPLPAERKQKYVQRAAEILQNIPFYNTGTAGFGDFHEGNIMFSGNTKSKTGTDVFTWIIDPEYVEKEHKADRMEDMTTFFLHTAIDTFAKYQSLLSLRQNIAAFFKGYDLVLSSYGWSLNKMYDMKQETSFAFHLGLNILLEALYTIKTSSPNDQAALNRVTACLVCANHCWTEGLK